MALYSLTYLINSFGIIASKKQKRIVNFVVIVLLVFTSGTRYYMGGNDVYVYEGMYNNVTSVKNVLIYLFTGVNNGINRNYEIGYTLLCAVCKSIGLSYFGFILVWSALFYTLMIKGLKEFVPNWGVFWSIFMYKIMFYDTFISIRQGLTIAIFCCMLGYLRDRKWKQYYILAILAFLEHRAALILAPVYFVTYLPTSKKFISLYALAWLPTYFLRQYADLGNIITVIANNINNAHTVTQWIETTETINIIHTLECYAIILCIVMFYDQIMQTTHKKEITLAIQLMLLAVPMFTLFSEWIILTREKDYFVLMYGVVLGYLIENKKLTWQIRIILTSIIVAACFIGMVRYVRVFDGGVLWNYQSWIFEGGRLFGY